MPQWEPGGGTPDALSGDFRPAGTVALPPARGCNKAASSGLPLGRDCN
ncbi:MAG: hypothetical protein ACI3ZO_10005 [Candidatus Cryptobacteroides sp.]